MIYLALPILNESDYLAQLLDCIRNQEITEFKLFICVNNYDIWWHDPKLISQCKDNQRSIKLLKDFKDLEVVILDKSSPGKGWKSKKGGVGHARKLLMDTISSFAKEEDIIVSIDADTFYPKNYLKKIELFFKDNSCLGLSIPYYHKLDHGNERLILHYEIYMRYYLINMFRINNPWAFTAVGSAMAFPVWAYRKVGGLTPVKSGEDFYFIQKLLKTGQISNWIDTTAYPSSRLSSRVDFGTGPALIKGSKGNWNSYPLYNYNLFDEVKNTFEKFEKLFYNEIETDMDSFLKSQFNTEELWEPLRKNYKDVVNFEKSCINKVDALRVLQFLKQSHLEQPTHDSLVLKEYLFRFHKDQLNEKIIDALTDFSFELSSISDLDIIRNFLYETEMYLRKGQFNS